MPLSMFAPILKASNAGTKMCISLLPSNPFHMPAGTGKFAVRVGGEREFWRQGGVFMGEPRQNKADQT